MGSLILEAFRTGAGYLQEYGIWVALGVFLFMLVSGFIRASQKSEVNQISPEVIRRQENIETTGNAIGCIGAIIVTCWILYMIIFG